MSIILCFGFCQSECVFVSNKCFLCLKITPGYKGYKMSWKRKISQYLSQSRVQIGQFTVKKRSSKARARSDGRSLDLLAPCCGSNANIDMHSSYSSSADDSYVEPTHTQSQCGLFLLVCGPFFALAGFSGRCNYFIPSGSSLLRTSSAFRIFLSFNGMPI